MADPLSTAVELADVGFEYAPDGFALRGVSLRFGAGEAVALVGPSGSGKTTLLHLISGVLTPQSGRIRVGEIAMDALDDAARRRVRLARFGLVFQELELLEHLEVRENILLQTVLGGIDPRTREARLLSLAAGCGIEALLGRRPRELSQGERQRVALCRALLGEPGLVLADEPTGNLDPKNARTVVDLLLDDARSRGATLIVVTHDHSALARFDSVVDLGKVSG